MDVIVQDWQYWGQNGWGVPRFDTTNYPNPEQFIKQLHGQVVITAVTCHISFASYFKPQDHKAIALFKQELYPRFGIPEVLFIIILKEPVVYIVIELMNTRFQSNKSYLKFPPVAHVPNYPHCCGTQR